MKSKTMEKGIRFVRARQCVTMWCSGCRRMNCPGPALLGGSQSWRWAGAAAENPRPGTGGDFGVRAALPAIGPQGFRRVRENINRIHENSNNGSREAEEYIVATTSLLENMTKQGTACAGEDC